MKFCAGVIVLVLVAQPALSQSTSMDCLPPLIPMLDPTPELVADFEIEIRQEFDTYFDEAQSYIKCLEIAGRTANAEIREVLAAHQRLFPQR